MIECPFKTGDGRQSIIHTVYGNRLLRFNLPKMLLDFLYLKYNFISPKRRLTNSCEAQLKVSNSKNDYRAFSSISSRLSP
jgi:hypothetical protein